MTHPELVLQMAQCLDAAGIPFMVGGSVCSSNWSVPRSTNDVDIVIEATMAQIEAGELEEVLQIAEAGQAGPNV